MSNEFIVTGSDKAIEDFIQSSIRSSTKIIEHYDFVIKDISSFISDPKLESQKDPVIKFLKDMRAHWQDFKKDAENNLKSIQEDERQKE